MSIFVRFTRDALNPRKELTCVPQLTLDTGLPGFDDSFPLGHILRLLLLVDSKLLDNMNLPATIYKTNLYTCRFNVIPSKLFY
jgi:hypothetical protein